MAPAALVGGSSEVSILPHEPPAATLYSAESASRRGISRRRVGGRWLGHVPSECHPRSADDLLRGGRHPTKPYVVKLHAQWCPVCMMTKGVWSRVETSYSIHRISRGHRCGFGALIFSPYGSTTYRKGECPRFSSPFTRVSTPSSPARVWRGVRAGSMPRAPARQVRSRHLRT
jgi:hypothetical protein